MRASSDHPASTFATDLLSLTKDVAAFLAVLVFLLGGMAVLMAL